MAGPDHRLSAYRRRQWGELGASALDWWSGLGMVATALTFAGVRSRRRQREWAGGRGRT